jgi:hypothetical protein
MSNLEDYIKEEIERYLEEIIKNESYNDLVNVFEIGKGPNNLDIEKTISEAFEKKSYFHLQFY